MKRSLLFSLAAVAAMSALADTSDGRFELGMVWESTESYTERDGYSEVTVRYFLDGETEYNGRSCMKLRSECVEKPDLDNSLVTLIYQEDGKIWFHARRNSDQWLLLYDFNIQEGETVDVAHVPYNYSESDSPEIFTYRLKCLERETEDGVTYLTMQELHDYPDDVTPPATISPDEINVWITGIGSESGLLWNYGNCLDGGWSRLKSASLGGKQIYPVSTGVENVVSPSARETGRYHIDGTGASQLDRGIVIVTYSDGTVRKSVVR